MSTTPSRALAVLRLCRIGTWFSPAADVLAGACVAHVTFGAAVAQAMVASVCLYGAGMVWNDVFDLKLDRTQRPERPLPSGALPVWFAVALAAALLVGGVMISPCPTHHAMIGALVLTYDALGKRVEWVGALNMGTLRALNLFTGAHLVVDQEAVPAEARGALLLAAVCYGIYIVAVTFLGIFEDTPSVPARAVSTVQAAPPIAAWAGVAVVQGGLWPAPAIAAVPALWFLRRNARTGAWPQAEIRRSMMYLLLGTMIYTALLAGAAGEWVAAGSIALAIPVARRIAKTIALT